MRIASWNLANRVGAVPFRPEAADAALALDADALFFCGYFPRQHGAAFQSRLAQRGWTTQCVSAETREPADRVLAAARVAMVAEPFARPRFDEHFAANLLRVRFPATGLRVLALRVPVYESRQRSLTAAAWDWIEQAANALAGGPAAIVGDFNASPASPRHRGGEHFQRILESGWTLATPADGASYFGLRGRTSVVDHLLVSPACAANGAAFVTAAGGLRLAGSPGAISDHAALVADVGTAGSRGEPPAPR